MGVGHLDDCVRLVAEDFRLLTGCVMVVAEDFRLLDDWVRPMDDFFRLIAGYGSLWMNHLYRKNCLWQIFWYILC